MKANNIASVLMLFVLVIFTIYLFQKGRKRYSNKMLILYFISQIIVVGNNTIFFSSPNLMNKYLYVYPIIFTWAPLFFLFFSSLMKPSFKLGMKHLSHFIPAAIIFIYLFFVYYSKDSSSKNLNIESISKIVFLYFRRVFNVQIISYNIASVIFFYLQQRKFKGEQPNQNKNFLFWTKISVFGFCIACFIVQISMFLVSKSMFSSVDWYFVGNISFFLFFTVLFYVAILNPEAIVIVQEKNKNMPVNETEAKKIIDHLDNYMITKKPFKKPNLSLKELSYETEIQERIISHIINEYKKQNFFDYINSFRVETAMELLSNPMNFQRTLFDILFDAGFNSKTTFNTAFKKYTGMTPSDFRKNQNFSLLVDQIA